MQNRLEDLAALLAFIHASRLDDLQSFRKYVIGPLMKGSGNGVSNLRQILDSVCLRRTKRLLDLPDVIFEDRLLSFSAKEEQHYIRTREKFVQMMKDNRLQPNSQKDWWGVFQLQLQLRRLCNHGTFHKLSPVTDSFNPQEAMALLLGEGETKCQVCSKEITGVHEIYEEQSGKFTVCGHLLCTECAPKMEIALQKIIGRDDCFQCSLCRELVFGNYLITEEDSHRPSESDSKHISAWQSFEKDGYSTKVSTVVADLQQSTTEEKR